MKIILEIIRKEFLQFKRDPKMFGIVLVAPIVQLIFLGYAATFDVNTIHTAVIDRNKTEISREFLDKFSGSGYFSFDYYTDDYDGASELIDVGDITLVIVIPDDFESALKSGKSVSVQTIFDASDGNTASIALGYVQGIVADYSKLIMMQNRFLNSGVPGLPVSADTRVWYNPEMKTRIFMVPGIVGLLLMIVTIILTSLAIVKEKEIGTMEQLIVTPIKPHQMLIGKLVPFAILGFLVIMIVLPAMYFVFGIGVRGSTLFLYFATFLYVLSTLGLGLFVSTISKTQQQAMMLAIFVIMLPMIYLSGFAFPIENMPDIIQYITYLIPLRYFMTIIRGVILKGIGFSELWVELLILAGSGVMILFLSVRRFKKRLG